MESKLPNVLKLDGNSSLPWEEIFIFSNYLNLQPTLLELYGYHHLWYQLRTKGSAAYYYPDRDALKELRTDSVHL